MTTQERLSPELILVDVYETLLNMSEIERKVNGLMRSKSGYAVWSELFMQYCFVDNCTIQFSDFSSIARATMQMAGGIFSKPVSENDIDDVLEHMKHLPLQEGVQQGLSKLKDQKYRVAALTNSPGAIVNDRMERTGLISYFESVLSAEHVKQYKPGIAVYQWAARMLNLPCESILFVSAHGWDIAGAPNAGMQTAFLKQGKQMLYPLAPAPAITISSLEELPEHLVRK